MGKIVLLDFDDTFETVIKGQIILNDKLIEALISAQKAGAKIVGFTNWFSFNYYKKPSPARSMLLEKLHEKGLFLDAITTTWNYLHVCKRIEERKERGQKYPDYLQTLSQEQRLALLQDQYATQIAPIEMQYSNANKPSLRAQEAMEKQEQELQAYAENAKNNLGLEEKISKEDPYYIGGKEIMFRAVFAVLGKDNEYIVFDDKAEVIHVAEALAKQEKTPIYAFLVQKMKSLQAGSSEDERYSYEKAVHNPAETMQQLHAAEQLEKAKLRLQNEEDTQDSLRRGYAALQSATKKYNFFPSPRWQAFQDFLQKGGVLQVQALRRSLEKEKKFFVEEKSIQVEERNASGKILKKDYTFKELLIQLQGLIGQHVQYNRVYGREKNAILEKVLIPALENFHQKWQAIFQEKWQSNIPKDFCQEAEKISLMLFNSSTWNSKEAREFFHHLNMATSTLLQLQNIPKEEQKDAVAALSEVYQALQNLDACSAEHALSFESKQNSLDTKLAALEKETSSFHKRR